MSSKQTVLVDINGLPGCGKTTLVEKVVARLEEANLSVYTIEDVYFHGEKTRVSKYVTILRALGSPGSRRANLLAYQLFSCFPFSFSRLAYTLRLIKFHYQLRKVYKSKDCDIIILEEGITQYTASIPHVDRLHDKKVLRSLLLSMLSAFQYVVVVNCLSDVETSLNRISTRGFKNGRFDHMNERERFEGLKIHYEFFEIMRDVLGDVRTLDLPMIDKSQSAEILTSYLLALRTELSEGTTVSMSFKDVQEIYGKP